MSSQELAKKISYWIRTYSFCGEVVTVKLDNNYFIQFEARTTKTRASSMVTRIKLISAEVILDVEFQVGKELLSEVPSDRSALATWKIFVRIPIHVRKPRTSEKVATPKINVLAA